MEDTAPSSVAVVEATLPNAGCAPAPRELTGPAAPSVGGRSQVVLCAATTEALAEKARGVRDRAAAGRVVHEPTPPLSGEATAERLGIEYGHPAELAAKALKALAALAADQLPLWRALRGVGIFRAHGPVGRVAFLYTGQGSQYVNMLRGLREAEPAVRETFDEADAVMDSFLGRRLSECVFADPDDAAAVARAEEALRDTAVLQPAILAVDLALTRLLAEHGFRPDLVMGHSLGEYGALVAAGVLPFAHALEAVCARGREMEHVEVPDPGRMAAVLAPLDEIEQVLATVDGYVVVANYNSRSQSVIGGETTAVERAVETFVAIGRTVVRLPVSHAFHTAIVSPASEALRAVLERLDVRPPAIPVVANLTGELYAQGVGARLAILDVLSHQMAAPVQFAKGLQTLYDEGARVFVEVGPKRTLQGFAEEAFATDPSVFSLFTNHPKISDAAALSQAVCGLRTACGDAPPRRERAPRFRRSNGGCSPRPTAIRRDVVPVARPSLALCKPTGVTLERGRRVVLMADERGVGLALVRRLEERGVKVLLVERRPPADELTGWLRAWLAEGPIHGLYWLAALDPEGAPADRSAFREARRSRLDLLHASIRALCGAPEGRSAFLLAATRTGRFAPGPVLPLGAAVIGFAKALRRERPDVLVKTVDLPALQPADAASLLVQETLADPGVVDVAWSGRLRLAVTLSEPVEADVSPPVEADSVFVVAGATRPGVPALVRALSAATRGATFHLVETASAPGVQAADDVATAIAAVERCGGRALAYTADLRDAAAADAVGREIASRCGRVDRIVHADAPAIDRPVEEKAAGAFAFVFDTRVEGWLNLTNALATVPVGASVVLQSTAGLFGRAGEADAAAAEELLATLVSRGGPGPRTLAIAWDRSPEAAAGVADLILEARTGRQTLVTSSQHALPPEWDETGGLDLGALDGGGPLVGAVRGYSILDGLRVETVLNPDARALLDEQRVAGRAVLPEAIGLETLAEAAVLVAPGWHVAALEKVEFPSPLVFGEGQPRPIEVRAVLRPDGNDLVAECRLLGAPAGGAVPGPATTHVVARVRLTATPPPPAAVERTAPRRCAGGLSPDDIYRVYAHAPAFRVLEGAWRTNAAAIGLMASGLPPGGGADVTAPRLFELCVQTAEVLEAGQHGRLAAPVRVECVRLARPAVSAIGSRLYAIVRPAADADGKDQGGGAMFDARVVDEGGNVYLDVRGCRTAAVEARADPDDLAALRDAMA